MKLKLLCWYHGHNYQFTGRTADWLKGGTYYWECSRCGKEKISKPYLGNY